MIKKSKAGRPVAFWTPDRIALLKKNYPISPNEDVAQILGTTVRAIRSKAMILKIKKKDRHWDKPEESFLLKNWPVMSAIELGDHLGKTRWAVINKYRELTGKR